MSTCLNGGVPLTLANTVFSAAKGMILGAWKGEEDDDETPVIFELGKLSLQENQRREAGWYLLEGLIGLGSQWMGTRLSMFFKLLNVSRDH